MVVEGMEGEGLGQHQVLGVVVDQGKDREHREEPDREEAEENRREKPAAPASGLRRKAGSPSRRPRRRGLKSHSDQGPKHHARRPGLYQHVGTSSTAFGTMESGPSLDEPSTRPDAPSDGEARTMPLGTPPSQTVGESARSSDLDVVPPGRFLRGREVARGGQGCIVEGRDPRLGRRVAIKEMLEDSPEVEERFEREARITSQLQHPGIVPVYEAGALAVRPPLLRHEDGRGAPALGLHRRGGQPGRPPGPAPRDPECSGAGGLRPQPPHRPPRPQAKQRHGG